MSDPADLCDAVRAAAAGERRLPSASPTVGAIQAARLATEDLPILGMLRHGVDAGEIAATLGLDDTTLVSRRGAMLESLSPAPDDRSEPRPIPWIHTTRTSLPLGGDLVARVELTPAPRLHLAVHTDDAALDERPRLATRVGDARELEELTEPDRVAADVWMSRGMRGFPRAACSRRR